MSKLIENIKKLEKKVTDAMKNKWQSTFDSQAMYVGSQTYSIAGLYSKDTRELYLMFIHQQEFNTEFK